MFSFLVLALHFREKYPDWLGIDHPTNQRPRCYFLPWREFGEGVRLLQYIGSVTLPCRGSVTMNMMAVWSLLRVLLCGRSKCYCVVTATTTVLAAVVSLASVVVVGATLQ